MPDKIANEIIREWDREETDSANTMSLYQQVADHFFMRENSITTKRTAGEDKSLPILDPTGALDLQDMAAGMSAIVIPTGQYFFRLESEEDDKPDSDAVRSYLAYATQIAHSQILKSNFVLQFNEFLMSWIGFGTGNLESRWDPNKLQLTYKDWDVSNFRFNVDTDGIPNRCLIRWAYTAEQAVGLWGDKAGEKVVKYANDTKRSQEKFWFIWRRQRRRNRDMTLSDSLNYPIEEIVINQDERIVVDKGGYRHFPNHIARWLLSSQEKWGRGQGTFALSADKELQVQKRALNLCAALQNTPPYETLNTFEGTPKIYPGANNIVQEANSINPLHRDLRGSFPVTKETLEMTRETIHRAFYVKVFAPLDNLPGDRRTTVEIIERVKAGYMRIILPVMRLYSECLTPLIERSVLLLLENHIISPPPQELSGFKVEYLGKLALALKEQQSDALQRFAQFSFGMEQVIPNFTVDNINIDRAGRRMATTFGVNENDLNTEEEREVIRQDRLQRQQIQESLMAAQSASKAYKDGSKKADDGSPAEQLMAGIGQ